MDGVGEVEFMSALADRCELEGRPVLCAGVVGAADLMHPRVGELLDVYSQLPRCRGVRDSVFYHASNQIYRATPVPNKLGDSNFRRGLQLLQNHGLTFETWVRTQESNVEKPNCVVLF